MMAKTKMMIKFFRNNKEEAICRMILVIIISLWLQACKDKCVQLCLFDHEKQKPKIQFIGTANSNDPLGLRDEPKEPNTLGRKDLKFTQEDLEYTAKKYGLTLDQVKSKLGARETQAGEYIISGGDSAKSKYFYVTPENLEYTAKKYGMTRGQVKAILGIP